MGNYVRGGIELKTVKFPWFILLLIFLTTSLSLAAENIPKLEIEYPPFPALQFRPNYIPKTNLDIITVRGKTEPQTQVWVHGKEVLVESDGSFKFEYPLEEGINTIRITAKKRGFSDSITIERQIIRDTTVPELIITEPIIPEGYDAIYIGKQEIQIRGKTKPKSRLMLNGIPVMMEEDGSFAALIQLDEGENYLYIAAQDEILPNINLKVIKIIVDNQEPIIEILSPDPKDIATTDYITVYGQTKPYAMVKVEDEGIEVVADAIGQFKLDLYLKEGRNYFEIVAIDRAGNETSEFIRVVKDTKPPEIKEFQPSGIVAYMPGDLLDISFASNELKCTGSFTVGKKGPFPITELTPGRYRGVYRIQLEDVNDSHTIQVTLVDEAGNMTTRNMVYLTVYDPAQPLVAILNAPDNAAVIRSGPSADYDRISHIGRGPRVEVTGRVDDYYRISPAKSFSAWTHKDNLQFLGRGVAPGKAVVTNVVVSENGADYTNVSFSLSDSVFYTVTPLVHEPALIVTFYNTTGGVYHIAWKENTDYVKLITPIQITDDILQYRIDLKGKVIYGYKDELSGNTMNLRIKSRFSSTLDGKTITIDPGHGPDSGAVGPTGLREMDLNLRIALKLKELLQEDGVVVFMTRDMSGNYAPGLYDRVAFAERNRTDIFVSIHNNAASNRSAQGSESYYFTPYSHELSRLTIKYMDEHQGSDYRFFAHRSFAVIRQWTMPAILTEGDYLSNYAIEAWQRTDDFSDKNAEAIYMAIKEYVETFGFDY